MFSACNRVAGRRTRTVYLYPPCTAYIHVLEVSARSREACLAGSNPCICEAPVCRQPGSSDQLPVRTWPGSRLVRQCPLQRRLRRYAAPSIYPLHRHWTYVHARVAKWGTIRGANNQRRRRCLAGQIAPEPACLVHEKSEGGTGPPARARGRGAQPRRVRRRRRRVRRRSAEAPRAHVRSRRAFAGTALPAAYTAGPAPRWRHPPEIPHLDLLLRCLCQAMPCHASSAAS